MLCNACISLPHMRLFNDHQRAYACREIMRMAKPQGEVELVCLCVDSKEKEFYAY